MATRITISWRMLAKVSGRPKDWKQQLMENRRQHLATSKSGTLIARGWDQQTHTITSRNRAATPMAKLSDLTHLVDR